MFNMFKGSSIQPFIMGGLAFIFVVMKRGKKVENSGFENLRKMKFEHEIPIELIQAKI